MEVANGRFRDDLYYRIAGVTIYIPPLRERVAEIKPLATTFIESAAKQLGRASVPCLGAEALSVLERYAWPGNIRELRNFVERAVLLADGPIEPHHLPLGRMVRSLALCCQAA